MCDVFHITFLSTTASHRSLFISCFRAVGTMSHYAPPLDNTIFYQSIHSTPPRRPSAGVSRHDSLPLPTLSRSQTEFSSTSAGPSLSYQGVASDTSLLWPWHKPAVDFDDREKMALVTDERHDLPKVSMRPWEGWRVVLLGSCGSMTFSSNKIFSSRQGLTYSSSSSLLP